jgi:predicted amidohydrolase
MENIRIATAQFENKSNDNDHNLSIIDRLSKQAALQGARMIAFHECSITGYTFARKLSREQMFDIAEDIPDGPSISGLIDIAKQNDIVVLAGLFEKDASGSLYKAYVCVDKNGLVARFRKLHPFINPYLTPGNEYCVFDLFGWKCGILICYDNNIIENVRATRLLGAQVIFMPHVTMCTPSTRPGAGACWSSTLPSARTSAPGWTRARSWLRQFSMKSSERSCFRHAKRGDPRGACIFWCGLRAHVSITRRRIDRSDR